MGKRSSRNGSSSRMSPGRELKTFLRNRMWRQHWYVLVSVVGIAVALFSAAIFRFSTSQEHMYRLDVENQPLLQRVFQSGEPWVVLCSKPNDAMPPVFSDAAKTLVNKSFVGVLDCSQHLPTSHKTVFKRFQLQRGKRYPTVFTVANGNKPQQIPREFLKSAKALGQRVLAQTSKRALEIRDPKYLTKCLNRPMCVLMLRGRRYSAYETQWLARLMDEHRAMQFAWIDATKWDLEIDEAIKVPAFVKGEHRMILFKHERGQNKGTKRGVLHAKAYRNAFELLPTQQFLAHHVEQNLKTVTTTPTMTRREVEEPDEAAQYRAERRADRKRRREERRQANSRDEKLNKNTKKVVDDIAEGVETSEVEDRRREDDEEEVMDLDALEDEE